MRSIDLATAPRVMFPADELNRAVWNIRHASFASGIPKKTLTNWLDRGLLHLESPGTGNSRRFSTLDVIGLAFLARLTVYGCNIERSEAVPVSRQIREEVARHGIEIHAQHTWRILSPDWFFVFCPKVTGYAGWKPEDVEVGESPRVHTYRPIGGTQPVFSLARSVEEAWRAARAYQWDVALIVDGLSVIQDVFSSLSRAAGAERGFISVETLPTVKDLGEE